MTVKSPGSPSHFHLLEEHAQELDALDPLAPFRDRFHLPKGPGEEPLIYFAGNSLGLQPKAAMGQVNREMQAWADAIKGQATPSGVGWADALSASVRPVLTYWWCLVLYTAAKMIIIVSALQADMPLAAFAALLVTEFDTAIIGSLFSFWFVDRALRKMGAK